MAFPYTRRRSSLGKLLSMVTQPGRPDMQIEFTAAHNDDHTWKTGDEIGGQILIIPSAPLAFDSIEVALVGQTECKPEAPSGRKVLTGRY